MATNNSINSNIPIEVSKGGTANTTFSTNSTFAYDGTHTKFVSVTNASGVLTSQGSGSAPIFVNLPTFFTPLASDPATPMPGDTWYNTTTNLFKGCVGGGVGSVWTIEANINNNRKYNNAAGSSGADAITYNGLNASGSVVIITERYTGISNTWTNKSNTPVGNYYVGGSGSANDALSAGNINGGSPNYTFRYNGISDTWSTKADIPAGAYAFNGNCCAGTSGGTMLSIGSGGFPSFTVVYDYDGSSNTWSGVSGTNNGRNLSSATGSTVDAITVGGDVVSSYNTAETYNGTSWTNVSNLNYGTSIQWLASAGQAGSNSLTYGGSNNVGGNSPFANTSNFVGMSNTWTSVANMNYTRHQLAGCGAVTDALAIGGSTTGAYVSTSITERYMAGSSSTIVTFTTS